MVLPIKTILKIGLPVALAAAAYVGWRLQGKPDSINLLPQPQVPIIAALGDSITFGSGVRTTREIDCWEHKLEQHYRGTYQVLNFGVSGATMQDEGDNPYWSTGMPESALALNPEIVILMLGTNDSKAQNWNARRFCAQLNQRTRELKAYPSVKRLILMCPPYCCPPDGDDTVVFGINDIIIRDEIRQMVKNCAEENEVECIDLFALTDGHPEYFADGVHPNKLGNQVIAEHLYEYLTKS